MRRWPRHDVDYGVACAPCAVVRAFAFYFVSHLANLAYVLAGV